MGITALNRKTGLDPALPLFDGSVTHHRLGPDDAYFVDIVHTDGGILGNPAAKGHADFYPNGGHALQPGCARQEIANNRWLGILSTSDIILLLKINNSHCCFFYKLLTIESKSVAAINVPGNIS